MHQRLYAIQYVYHELTQSYLVNLQMEMESQEITQ